MAVIFDLGMAGVVRKASEDQRLYCSSSLPSLCEKELIDKHAVARVASVNKEPL